MPVVAIEGRHGSEAREIGRRVALTLEIDFVDRLLLAEIARRVGSTVQAVAESEQQPTRVVDRLARLVQRMLERSAVAGSGGDPYFGPGVETLLSRPYRELEGATATSSIEVAEQQFIATTREVIRDIAEDGSVVILSRGGAAILQDNPKVLRVGVVADVEDRVRRTMAQEQLEMDAARQVVEQSDASQGRYFQKAFDTVPTDPFVYHVMVNTSDIGIDRASELISGLARALQSEGSLA